MFRSVVLRSTTSLSRPTVPLTVRGFAGEVADGGGKFAARERAFENKAVHEKDAELLKKLRATLALEDNEAIPDNVVQKVVEEAKPLKREKIRKEKKPTDKGRS